MCFLIVVHLSYSDRAGWKKKNVILHFSKDFQDNFFDFYSHWESWFAQQQPAGCSHENKINPNILLLVEFNSRLWFCGLSCVITEERVVSFNIFLLKISNYVNSRWLFSYHSHIWRPLEDVVNKREEDPWKSFHLCWKLLLELFGRSPAFPSPSGKSGQASSHCFCRKCCGKDQAAQCWNLLKMPWAAAVSLHTHTFIKNLPGIFLLVLLLLQKAGLQLVPCLTVP